MAGKFAVQRAMLGAYIALVGVCSQRSSSQDLSGCTFGFDSEYSAHSTAACSFSTVYRCPHGTLSELTCTNAHVGEIFTATQAFVENGGEKLNLYLMWATYDTRKGMTPIILNRNSLSPRAGSLIQTVYLYIDSPSSILEPSLFEIFPNLKSLQIELLHPTRANATVDLRDFSGYFKLNTQLEYLYINTVNEPMSIDKGTLANLPALKCLKLVGARYKCDCAMQDFIADLSSRVPSPLQGEYADDLVHPMVSLHCGAPYAFCDAETSELGDVIIPVAGTLHVEELSIPNCPSGIPVSYPVRLVSTCNSDFIQFELLGSLPSASYSILGFFNQAEAECQAVPGSQIIATVPGHCGITVKKDEDGTVRYKGKLLLSLEHHDDVAHLEGHPDVVAVEKVAYSVSCVVKSNVVVYDGGKAEPKISLSIPSADIQVGRYAFEITATGTQNAWELGVQSCWVTRANYSQSAKKYEVIHDGCLVDPSAVQDIRKDSDQLSYRYSFVPLKFRGEIGAVYVHCTVRKCDKLDENFDSCIASNPGCLPSRTQVSRNSNGRTSRKRRDVLDGEIAEGVEVGQLTVLF